MDIEPKVTVLMPVYNGENYVRAAIDSILNQTFIDFEFLIVNDGSTDGSVALIESYRDPRIKLVHNEKNMGLVATLNKGVDLARGTYIARMDCDDISLPTRLQKQVAYMEMHPTVGVCGTWIKIIGNASSVVWSYPTDADEIKCRLLFESVLPHPSVIMRKEMFKEWGLYYDPLFRHAEDYELWVRAARKMPLANIGEALLFYRAHAYNVGMIHKDEQSINVRRIQLLQLDELHIDPTPLEIEIFQTISHWQFKSDRHFVENVEKWLLKLLNANNVAQLYPEPAFSRELARRWFAACNAAFGLGLWALRVFMRSPLRRGLSLDVQQLVFAIKCLIYVGKPHE